MEKAEYEVLRRWLLTLQKYCGMNKGVYVQRFADAAVLKRMVTQLDSCPDNVRTQLLAGMKFRVRGSLVAVVSKRRANRDYDTLTGKVRSSPMLKLVLGDISREDFYLLMLEEMLNRAERRQ